MLFTRQFGNCQGQFHRIMAYVGDLLIDQIGQHWPNTERPNPFDVIHNRLGFERVEATERTRIQDAGADSAFTKDLLHFAQMIRSGEAIGLARLSHKIAHENFQRAGISHSVSNSGNEQIRNNTRVDAPGAEHNQIG